MNHPNKVYAWAISALARVFETTSLDIQNDYHLKMLTSAILSDVDGCGTREQVTIRFNARLQSLIFESHHTDGARWIAEAIRGARNGRAVAIVTPKHLYEATKTRM